MVGGLKPLFLIWDGHPTHKYKEVAAKVQSYKGKLPMLLLPGYRRELNPGEGLWRKVKARRLGKGGIFPFADMKSKALGALRH